jgi:hypothetical protein
MKNREPDTSDKEQRREELERHRAYRSVHSRLIAIAEEERRRDELARARTGIDVPAKLYGVPTCLLPRFHAAMQRLWSIGTLPEGCTDTELRRVYHLVARGRAPLRVQDVIYLGTLPDSELIPLLGWLAHRCSLAEAQKKVATGQVAPPVTRVEDDNFVLNKNYENTSACFQAVS